MFFNAKMPEIEQKRPKQLITCKSKLKDYYAQGHSDYLTASYLIINARFFQVNQVQIWQFIVICLRIIETDTQSRPDCKVIDKLHQLVQIHAPLSNLQQKMITQL